MATQEQLSVATAGRSRRLNRERIIEDAILRNPAALGFPGALAIRNCRIGPPSGLVDVVLLPQSGPVDLVLVEAKARAAADATSKVIGQLLMYYAGALSFGMEGLSLLRRFAEENAIEAEGYAKISPKKLTGVSPATKAWEVLKAGATLSPSRVQLYVALDEDPHAAFLNVLAVLRAQHGLNIGFCVVRDGSVVRTERPDVGLAPGFG